MGKLPAKVIAALLAATTCATFGADQGPFVSASGVDEVRRNIASLPDDDLWTSVRGSRMAWLHKNVHRVLPTVNVYREGPVRELAADPNPAIAAFPVDTPDGSMTFGQFLRSDQSTTMAMVVLHKGRIVFEDYPRQQPYEKPIYWSVAKVLVSTLVGILEHRGQVDVSMPIDHYLPELAGSSFEGITVRNILDMATGIDCPEDYEDRESCYYTYSKAIGEGHYTASDPDDPYAFVASVRVGRYAEQGTSYSYSGVNTFILGWLVEKLTGMPFQDAFTREVWSRIGAESDASFLAPRFGVPITHGGFMARARDLARFGLLFTPSHHVVADQKVIPDALLETWRTAGNPVLLENQRGGAGRPADVRYNIYQWDQVYENNDFFKGGWGGQGLLVNPDRDLVAVYSGYFKEDFSEVDPLPLLRKVLNGVYPP